jgi:hypothetical protein
MRRHFVAEPLSDRLYNESVLEVLLPERLLLFDVLPYG